MAKKAKNDPILTPELIKIIKIFGVASISLVLILSFFNERRANNRGEDNSFKMVRSDQIYFLNLRASNYDRENRTDAGMILFRHSKRYISDTFPSLDLIIILNSFKEEAYLNLEPVNNDWPIRLRVTENRQSKEFLFQNGNKQDHLTYVTTLRPWIEGDASFELFHQDSWVRIWDSPKEKELLKTILKDYFNLLNQNNQ
jgi:hypothetical protein